MEPYRSRTYSINDFLNWSRSRSKELNLNPRFQRRNVWDDKAKSYLIDTILRGFPIPIIFLRETVDPKELKTVREVVDGQQRLRAILDFISGDLVILKSHSPDFGGRRFTDLTEEEQRKFLSYELPVDLLGDASDADVLEVFARLNSYTLTLNSQEKLNSKYYGRFKQVAYELGRQHLEFWRMNRILGDRAIVRMGEAELASELVVTMLDGLQDGKSKLETFYKKFDEDFPQARRVTAGFKETIDNIGDVMGQVISQTAFRNKANFYSLFALFYDMTFGLPGSDQRIRIGASQKPKVRDALVELIGRLKDREPGPDIAPFVSATRSSTDNLPQRQTRHSYMLETVKTALSRM